MWVKFLKNRSSSLVVKDLPYCVIPVLSDYLIFLYFGFTRLPTYSFCNRDLSSGIEVKVLFFKVSFQLIFIHFIASFMQYVIGLIV